MKLTAAQKEMIGWANHGVGRVLVLDGKDVVGHRVVERLIDGGYSDLRVGMRTAHGTASTPGLETVPFVWEDESTYDAALADVTTVFVTLPVKPDDFDVHFPAFLKACSSAKVRRVVKLSFYHAIASKADHMVFLPHMMEQIMARCVIASHDGFHDISLVHKHALCDGDLFLQRDKFEVAIVFASHLMSNVFRYGFERKALSEKNEFYGSSGGKGVNYVSPNDVADMAVKAIFEKTHTDQAYIVTGPSAITDEAVAGLLSDKLGRKITYVEKSLDSFDRDMAGIEKVKATGMEENFPVGDVKRCLGRDAETFEQYLNAVDGMSPCEQRIMMAGHPVKSVDATGASAAVAQPMEAQ